MARYEPAPEPEQPPAHADASRRIRASVTGTSSLYRRLGFAVGGLFVFLALVAACGVVAIIIVGLLKLLGVL